MKSIDRFGALKYVAGLTFVWVCYYTYFVYKIAIIASKRE